MFNDKTMVITVRFGYPNLGRTNQRPFPLDSDAMQYAVKRTSVTQRDVLAAVTRPPIDFQSLFQYIPKLRQNMLMKA